jgi:hypothetical protein
VEAIVVTCLLRGNHGARKFGWTCLESAILLRLSQLVPFKTSYHTSPLEKRVFGTVRQVKNIEELNALKCKTSLREIEALGLHTLKRFLTKYNHFSPMILPSKVSTLFLKGTFLLDEMLSSPSRIFSVSLFLVELFQTYSLTVTS